MNLTKGLRAERLIAKRYEEHGYVVTLEPPPSAIPFPLGNYRPDILATKGDEQLIIEVKTAGARVDSEAYFRLDQEIQQHPGWRFLLVTVTEADLQENSSSSARNVSVESIRAHLGNLDRLVEDPEITGLVLPRLWTAYVSVLRQLALQQGVELDDCNDLGLLNRAYSGGVISFDEYEAARRLMMLRNHAVHSLDSLEKPDDCKQLRQMVDSILNRLSAPAPAVQ